MLIDLSTPESIVEWAQKWIMEGVKVVPDEVEVSPEALANFPSAFRYRSQLESYLADEVEKGFMSTQEIPKGSPPLAVVIEWGLSQNPNREKFG